MAKACSRNDSPPRSRHGRRIQCILQWRPAISVSCTHPTRAAPLVATHAGATTPEADKTRRPSGCACFQAAMAQQPTQEGCIVIRRMVKGKEMGTLPSTPLPAGNHSRRSPRSLPLGKTPTVLLGGKETGAEFCIRMRMTRSVRNADGKVSEVAGPSLASPGEGATTLMRVVQRSRELSLAPTRARRAAARPFTAPQVTTRIHWASHIAHCPSHVLVWTDDAKASGDSCAIQAVELRVNLTFLPTTAMAAQARGLRRVISEASSSPTIARPCSIGSHLGRPTR